MDMTFCELKLKEVVNTATGKKMGRPIDVVFDCHNADIVGLIVPGEKKFLRACEDIFIPWRDISKIGDDVILVIMKCIEENEICVPEKKCKDKD